jgi:hypothetical protein
VYEKEKEEEARSGFVEARKMGSREDVLGKEFRNIEVQH